MFINRLVNIALVVMALACGVFAPSIGARAGETPDTPIIEAPAPAPPDNGYEGKTHDGVVDQGIHSQGAAAPTVINPDNGYAGMTNEGIDDQGTHNSGGRDSGTRDGGVRDGGQRDSGQRDEGQ